MPEFTIHTIESAPEASRETLEAVESEFGFLPNLLGELAAAPVAAKAYAMLHGLLGESSFEPHEVQLLLASVSVENACDYCVAAHTGGMKQAGLADDEIQAVREGRPLSDERLEALRRFATVVVGRRGHPGEEEVERFLEAGFRQEQILEVLVAVAMKTLSNYTNHIAETRLDDELSGFAWEPAPSERGATAGAV